MIFLIVCSIILFKFTAVGSQRPDYPSSKPKKVDWDKLEAQIRKEV